MTTKPKEPKLERTAFRTSRLLEFLSRKELTAQIGYPVREWPLVLVKELLDNSIDACEEAGLAPDVQVAVDPDGVVVTDNGPGIPPEVVSHACDFSVRVSSREAYVSPTRGAQGNALKGILAMPFVLDGSQGRVDITACGVRHEIAVRVDRVRQQPVIDHQQHPDGLVVKTGASVRVYWPNSPCSPAGNGDGHFLQNGENEEDGREETGDDEEDDLEETGTADDDSCSILSAAKARFLQIAEDFTFLNPHLTLTVNWHGQRFHVPASDPGWKKWGPRDPTCAHWYGPEHLERLVAAYVAHDRDLGKERTVRELVAEFRGLAGTAKQKAVLEATGLGRTNLSGLVVGDDLDKAAVGKLLAAMKANSRPVKPADLGLVGKAHLEACFRRLDCEPESFQYRKCLGEMGGIPSVWEVAFAWRPAAKQRRMVAGVNWSPGIVNPFRKMGRYGEALDSILEQQRTGRNEPVVMVLHLVCPRTQFADRGKSSVVIEG
jgi:hypothetical protein